MKELPAKELILEYLGGIETRNFPTAKKA